MPPPPENVIRIAHNETLYEIQWSPIDTGSINRQDIISHYTVFWCLSNVREGSAVQCLGQLHSQDVPAEEKTATQVTVLPVSDAPSNYQFAVAANRGDRSSGMVWSTPFVLANMKQLIVQVVPQSSSSLQVSWSLPSSKMLLPVGGIITGFNIYYCPIVGDNSKCKGESMI